MNPYKVREFVKYADESRKGLTTLTGGPVPYKELMSCLGLDEVLSKEEQAMVIRELLAIDETNEAMDRVRLHSA